MPYFRALKAEHISYKIGDDPVTIADQNAELALSARLLDLLPGSKVVGEEAFSSNHSILSRFFDESPVWIIDPIDGTRNFVQGMPKFGVIVALSKQDQTVAGWIYDPTSKEIVEAELGSGAFYKGKRVKIPNAPSNFKDMTGFLGDRVIERFSMARFEARATAPQFEVMSAGAHEYPALVLDEPHFGSNTHLKHFRASLYHVTPWDDAAGVLIHQEAGGYSSLWNGTAYHPSIMHLGLALAPNKELWQELRSWCASFAELPK